MATSHEHADDDLDSEMIELLVGDLRCPSCGSAFAVDGVSLTFTASRDVALSCQCARCGAGSTMTISINNASLSAELTPGEAFRFSQLRPLHDGDLASMRALLRSYRGDMLTLLD